MIENILNILKTYLTSNSSIVRLIVYYIISMIIWSVYFGIVNLFGKRHIKFENYKIKSHDINKINKISIIINIIILLIFISIALKYVGYLPYGPDTNGYTYAPVQLDLNNGHWTGEGYSEYYKPFHTAAIMYTLLYWITSSEHLSFLSLISLYAIYLILVASLTISKFFKNNISYTFFLATILFIITPTLAGLDLLQQYIALVYSISSISIIFIYLNRDELRALIVYILFIIIAIITHLTSVILALIPLIFYIAIDRRRIFLWFSLIPLIMAIIYSFYVVSLSITLPSIIELLKSLREGTLTSPTVRAYGEIASAKIGLLSWTLLPSITFLYIVKFIIKRLIGFNKSISNEINNNFIFLIGIYALGLLLIAFVSKFTGVDLSRYLWIPSYYIMYILVLAFLSKFLVLYISKHKILFIIFLLLLLPYAYSAFYDPHRNPEMGELRLGPVTYVDRIEMLILAEYGHQGYYVIAWHDIRIPIEWVNRTLFYKNLYNSYYPIHDIMVKVAMDKQVNIPTNTYIIIHKEFFEKSRLSNYSVVVNAREHIILIPQ